MIAGRARRPPSFMPGGALGLQWKDGSICPAIRSGTAFSHREKPLFAEIFAGKAIQAFLIGSMAAKAPPILLVEDNEDDAFFILKAFDSLDLPVTIHHCRNGQEAIDYLEPQALFPEEHGNSLPQLIVLDLKMPGKSGFDVLDWIRHRKHSLSVVVIILSSSPSQNDIEKADEYKINAYWVKPVGFRDMQEVARCICHLWFNHIPEPLQEHLFEPVS